MPGAAVLLANGSSKPIEKIKIGDLVVATDPASGRTAAKAVTRLISGEGDKNLVRITVDADGAHGDRTGVLVATDHHPFWVPELHRWVDATDLQRGQWLQTSAGTWLQVTAITRWIQHVRVHNLTVHGIHTYYVVAGNTPVLVHNCGVGERAAERQNALPAGSQGRVTMGVGEGVDASGATRTVVGTSEANGYLRPGVRDMIRPGEEVATGPGHAETSILDYMKANGITPGKIGAGRPICPACAVAIDEAGAVPGSPLKR
ncbi:polymorphic toxin-type HINT domain-containing protein [Plantactinospora sp. KBS50]|uniref:polymorphic toxin-type HINT domain-containing protein n=1 Tax=Plantactinospora sp. KBS50 TaxID=2024580 RepID=UPI000BAB0027|nr:polymorphic toxin-type HINT domain-containing protein [Plantactinospora sp. KBS50]ASW54356.1 hypothetical protein CIK06_09360 [Plantactinospora sp. KBS50]